jgi:hypothetical protein
MKKGYRDNLIKKIKDEKNLLSHHQYRGLECLTWVDQDELGILAFLGKKNEPQVYVTTRDKERFDECLKDLLDIADDDYAAKEARKELKAQRKKYWVDSLKIGSILYTSWGYDQTNVSFFQVVGRPTKYKVEFREINYNLIVSHALSGKKSARRDDFIGVIKCSTISENGISCEYDYKGRLLDNDDREICCSWGH